MARIVIFTDLDGTLLHPKSYSFNAALPALNLIKEKEIPLILCSSKTKAEIEVWRKRLENFHPFISENGGGIFIPERYFSFTIDAEIKGGYRIITLGRPYSETRNAFIEIRKRLKIKVKGFGDMLTEEIAELAGLPLSEAMLAKARDFDEPLIFEEEPPFNSPLTNGGVRGVVEGFLDAIEDAGLHWTHGRFYHLLGDNDKGKAVKILKGFYEKEYGKITTIGLGDNLNDLPMLKEVDHPILVRRGDGSYEERIMAPNLIKAEGIGPEGWNRAVLSILTGSHSHESGNSEKSEGTGFLLPQE